MKIRFFFFLIFLFAVNALFAQKLQINEFGFKLEESERDKIMLLAEYEALLYNDLFNTNRNDTLPIIINLYKKTSDFKKACKEAGSPSIQGSGVYYPHLRECYVLKHDDFIQTVVHEMGHTFMHHNMKVPPRWLNEGLSEFFESLSVSKGKVSVSFQPRRISEIQKAIGFEKFSFSQFLTLESDWRHQEKADDMYNFSYGIIFFLMKTNPQNLKKLVAAYQKKTSSISAIQSLYGSLSVFEQNYNLFYKRYRLP